jgi:hypothetical protein
VRLQRADRRRLVFASALTVIALPAVWLANRDDDRGSRPNVAAVGLAAEDASNSESEGAPSTSVDPMGYVDPLFSGEPTAESVGSVAVAVGSTDSVVATPWATHSRSVWGDTCRYNGIEAGTTVTIVNPANGRSLECVIGSNDDDDELTLHPDRFALLADLTVAPVRVEIHRDG